MPLNAASEKKLVSVKPDLVRIVRRAAEIAPSFQIVQGNRTQTEQDAIYAQGRTKPGPIVTWTRNSKHIGGNAIDFAALLNGAISWNEKLYPPIALAFKKAALDLGIKIEWGGDWKTKDWGHVQLTVSTQAQAPVPTPAVPILKRGMSGAAVTALQKLLGIAQDGKFGQATEANVKAFQKAKGLVADGIVGLATWTALAAKPVPATPAAPQDNPSTGMARFQQAHGWPKQNAAAFIGRAQQEAFMDIRTGVEGDQQTAFGGWQWRMDRKVNLQSFAALRGKPWTDWDTQIDFVVHELAIMERRAGEMLKSAMTLEQACEAAMAYCRPLGFKWDNPRAGHGWLNTLRNAAALMGK